jgi:hypothetical protein
MRVRLVRCCVLVLVVCLGAAGRAVSNGTRSSLSLQFSIENLSNNVYLFSKESTMVQGQYSIPRLVSGAVKLGF